jgi:hypothetical protein
LEQQGFGIDEQGKDLRCVSTPHPHSLTCKENTWQAASSKAAAVLPGIQQAMMSASK